MHQTLNGISPATLPGRGEPATRTRLRVGTLVDAPVMQRWHAAVLAELLGTDFCELTILALNGRSAPDHRRPHAPASLPLREIGRHLLYRLYERADRRKFGLPGDPMSPARLDEIALGAVRRLPDDGTSDGVLSPAALEAIEQEELDVLVCLDTNADLRLLAGHARFGAWSFEAAESRPGPPFFRELSATNGDIISTIHAVTGRYGERVVCRSSTSTEPLSLHRNRSATHAKAAHLLVRCLMDLHGRGWDAIIAAPRADVGSRAQRAIPTTRQMLSLLWRVYLRRLRVRLRGYLLEEQWYLAYRRHPSLGRIETPAVKGNGSTARCTVVRPLRGHIYADPFVLRCNDCHLVFFEDYDRSSARGAISYIEIDDRGRCSAPRRALERDYHLSYPFLFREGEDVYMLPETWSQRRIELYRATRFPCEWKLERVLMEDIPAADPTLLYHHGTFWLFTAVASSGGPPLDELYLFFGDSLFGEWLPHPMNPVVANAGAARPAGRIFLRDGQLIRPAQDCARSFGRRVILNRIEVLDRTRYREIPVGSIEAAWTRLGAFKTHSYNADGDYEVFDGHRLQPKVWIPRVGQRPASWASGRFRIALSERDRTDTNH